MIIKRFLYYITAVALMAAVVACSTSRRAPSMPMIGSLTGMDYMEKVIEWSPKWNNLTAKASLDVRLDGGKNARVGATLRIRRGEVIQLSVAPLLGIEMARMEITPEEVLLIDRLHKRYVRASFATLSQFADTELNFNILQSLFLNEFFLPEKPRLAVSDAVNFRITPDEDRALLETKPGKLFSYRFWTTVNEGWLTQTRIGMTGTDYALNWTYDDFARLDGKSFPQQMNVRVDKGGRNYFTLDMKLSRLSTDGGWASRAELSSKYKEVELQELLKSLLEK